MERFKESYAEIFSVLDKYKDTCVFDIEDMKRTYQAHLFGMELKELYGLDIDPKRIDSAGWIRLSDFITVGYWGEKYHRTVSWSDNGKQPKDELLLYVGFPTGAYIFGVDYPTDLFQKFFLELKSYKPKYTDTHNHCLYFSMNNAGKFYNAFKSVFNKYVELDKSDYKQRQILKMKADLEKLESGI